MFPLKNLARKGLIPEVFVEVLWSDIDAAFRRLLHSPILVSVGLLVRVGHDP